MRIIVNGEPLELDRAISVSALLERLQIDARRVAVEHNLTVLKRGTFETTQLGEGDEIEIVNFVGGGESQRVILTCEPCSGVGLNGKWTI